MRVCDKTTFMMQDEVTSVRSHWTAALGAGMERVCHL